MTIEIPLTKGYVAIVDDCDADLAQYNWFAEAKDSGVYGRRVGWLNGIYGRIALHQEVMTRALERPLNPGELVDHKDRDGLNCVRGNLRVASRAQNKQNSIKPKNNTSGFKGVSFDKRSGKWTAQIGMNNRTVKLGHFPTPELAAEAYKKAANELFGEFARFE